MTIIELDIHDDVVCTINKFKEINDSGIELIIPEGSVLFENIINIKLIKEIAQKENVVIQFTTNDEAGKTLISMVEDGYVQTSPIAYEEKIEKESPKISLPKIGIPSFKLFKLPKIGMGRIPLFLLLTLLIGGSIFYILILKTHKASAQIIVNAQPLTRSITVKVKAGTTTNINQKILTGTKLQATVNDSLEENTTGEKQIGETAGGEITIYNRTDEEKEFKKGSIVLLSDNEDYQYKLKDDVIVDAKTYEDAGDPNDNGIPGEANVEVEATDVGEKYNVDKGESLKLEGFKTTKFIAKAKTDIDGGKSETVRVVSKEDQDNLNLKLAENLKQKAEDALGKKTEGKQKFIKGSEYLAITTSTYNHNVGDEAEKISLNQEVMTTGLAYNTDELNSLLDELTADLVPEGFMLSDDERNVNVEVLGNSTNSVLNSSEADIQVTLKTYIVPDINEKDIKKELVGKSLGEAQKTLGSIKNIKSYELKISPKIPFLLKVPNNINKIEISIERSE